MELLFFFFQKLLQIFAIQFFYLVLHFLRVLFLQKVVFFHDIDFFVGLEVKGFFFLQDIDRFGSFDLSLGLGFGEENRLDGEGLIFFIKGFGFFYCSGVNFTTDISVFLFLTLIRIIV